jgi:hypothetical protein
LFFHESVAAIYLSRRRLWQKRMVTDFKLTNYSFVSHLINSKTLSPHP